MFYYGKVEIRNLGIKKEIVPKLSFGTISFFIVRIEKDIISKYNFLEEE
jgi:hypothetical protein